MPSVRSIKAGGILIPKQLLDRVSAERAAKLPLETGGYLLGRRRGDHIEVTNATFQHSADIATSASFERADPAHAADAVDFWHADRKLCGVVGDWHTHPRGPTHPSGTDREAWKILAKAERAAVLGIVVGEAAIGAYVARYTWGGLKLHPCVLVEDGTTELVFSWGSTQWLDKL